MIKYARQIVDLDKHRIASIYAASFEICVSKK